MYSSYKRIILSFVSIVFLNIIACAGGGSEGTGIISIEGKLISTDNKPIAGSRVSVDGSNDVVITDNSGRFVLTIESNNLSSDSLQLIVETAGIKKPVILNNILDDTDGTAISIQIKIDPADQQIEATNLDVKAKIVGLCDFYFENLRIIRQSNSVPGPINCALKVSIRADGKALSDVPFIIEYTGCSESRGWTPLSSGETRTAPIPGVGQLEFPFTDNTQTCVYRVLAPYGLDKVEPVETKIYTFSKQAYDANK